MARYTVLYGEMAGRQGGYVVKDTQTTAVVMATDFKPEAIAASQRLNGFDPIDGDEQTYGKQVLAVEKAEQDQRASRRAKSIYHVKVDTAEEMRQEVIKFLRGRVTFEDSASQIARTKADKARCAARKKAIEELVDFFDELNIWPTGDTESAKSLQHQRDLIAAALGKVLVHYKVIRDDASLTGPELLLAAETATEETNAPG